jgi:hypothetical protein
MMTSSAGRFSVHVNGDTAAVVLDQGGAVGHEAHVDEVADACEDLVNAVVHDLVEDVVQAAGTGGADIHSRAPAHGLEAFEHPDLRGIVGLAVGHLTLSFGLPTQRVARRPLCVTRLPPLEFAGRAPACRRHTLRAARSLCGSGCPI